MLKSHFQKYFHFKFVCNVGIAKSNKGKAASEEKITTSDLRKTTSDLFLTTSKLVLTTFDLVFAHFRHKKRKTDMALPLYYKDTTFFGEIQIEEKRRFNIFLRLS